MKVLITGGAGYIGSHAALALLQGGYKLIVLDNLSNGSLHALNRIQEISKSSLVFIEGDLINSAILENIFEEHSVDGVLHFAGLKSVAESVNNPLIYCENNISGTINLLRAMQRANVFKIVFSSSATVYGDANIMPISELEPTGKPTNPYGHSKLVIEQILQNLAQSDTRWSIANLRYFNPVGAHPSGQIGEDPKHTPSNLLPYITQVAVGKLSELKIYGNDYPTSDGTGVRDYIHVVDLAEGHLSALNYLNEHSGNHIWNLGTGNAYSVLEMLRAFQHVTGISIPYLITPRRSGDVAICYADPSKAERELGWKAKRGLHDMISDAWRWQSINPNGYRLENT